VRVRSLIPLWLMAAAAPAALAAQRSAGAPAEPVARVAAGGLTIHVVPNPSLAGEAVLVYGRLGESGAVGKRIVLHERARAGARFRPRQSTLARSGGFYEFALAAGAVTTSHTWFVSSPSTGGQRSRTVLERVEPLLTLEASAATGDTKHPITFSGSVTPAGVHVGEQVLVQQLAGSAWQTIARATIGPGSSYSVAKAFPLAGEHDLRAELLGDGLNEAGVSDTLTLTIEQAQHLAFTIAASAPVIVAGGSTTISGLLFRPDSSTPAPLHSVMLWGRRPGGAFAPLATTLTAPDGSYSFTESPLTNEVYQARTSATASTERTTSELFVGVAPTLTIAAFPDTADVGGTVTFTGTVTPDEAGAVIYLERQGTDGAFHLVRTGIVNALSTYQFPVTVGAAGTQVWRAFTPGGEGHLAGHSASVAVTVSLPPALSELPAA
jgi:hypothetical protein